MPTLSDAIKPPDMKDLVQVLQPAGMTAPPTANPGSMPNYEALSLAPAPPILSLDIDRQRQFYRGGVSQYRISPLPSKSNAGINASARTIVNRAIAGIPSAPPVPPVTDGLTHGDLVWEHDSAYVELRDDFVPFYSTTFGQTLPNNPVGELGWFLQPSSGAINLTQNGGNPPYVGWIAWDNNGTASSAASLLLNAGQTATTETPSQFQRNSFALLENPGWKMTWVFKHDGSVQSTGNFQITKKAFYIGLSGAPIQNLTSGTTSRPDIFIGLRYDTSVTPGALTLTSVANPGVYTGTITGGANGAYIGLTFVVTGFVNGANNGSFICTQSSATQLTLNNPSAINETHAGTATGPSGLNDSFYTFEAVVNPQYQVAARHNLQGQTFVTTVAPTMGLWHRLDITCSAAGVVVMTLDGSSTNTVTWTIPKVTYNAANGTAACTSHEGSIAVDTIGTSGSASTPPYCSGSIITISNLLSVNLALNGTWTTFYGDGASYKFDAPAVANIGNNSTAFTLVGYSALTPMVLFGNDDTASPTTGVLRTFVDFFSFVWNPNLGSSAPGTPDKTKARYW